MVHVKKFKTNWLSTESNCADKLCEPAFKKMKCSHNYLNYYQEYGSTFNSNQSIVYTEEGLNPNLPKYVSKDSKSDTLGINFERLVENKQNLTSLTSIIESAFSVFQNAHFILNQPVFSPSPRIQIPCSDIPKYFGKGNDLKPGTRKYNESSKSAHLESDQATEEVKSKFVINLNKELDIEASDIWPYSLGLLEFLMAPSVGIQDSRNWDVIDNISLRKARKINSLSFEAKIDQEKSSICNSASITNSQASFASDTRLQCKQYNENIFNEPNIQHRPSCMIDVETIPHSNKTNNAPLGLKNSLSRENNKCQESVNDEDYYCDLGKKNEIGCLNITAQDVSKFKQVEQDTTISEHISSLITSFFEERISNLPSNSMQPDITSASIVPVTSASSYSSEMLRKSNNEPHSISSIISPVQQKLVLQASSIASHNPPPHSIYSASMSAISLKPTSELDKTTMHSNLPSLENLSSTDSKNLIMPENCANTIYAQDKSIVNIPDSNIIIMLPPIYDQQNKNLTENDIFFISSELNKIRKGVESESREVNMSTLEQIVKSKVLSGNLPTYQKPYRQTIKSTSLDLVNNCSDLHTSQKLYLSSLHSTGASVLTKMVKPIPEGDKSILHSYLTYSQNIKPHSVDSARVSAGNNLCHMAQVINSTECNNSKSFIENENFDSTLPVIENIFSLSSAEKMTKECNIHIINNENNSKLFIDNDNIDTTLPVIENIFSLSSAENIAKENNISCNDNENNCSSLIGPLINETTNKPFYLRVPTSSVKEVLASLKINSSNINLVKS